MPTFNGFPEGKEPLIPMPEEFFSQLLPQIDHIGELKFTVYIIWRLSKKDGKFRYLSLEELTSDSALIDLVHAAGSNLEECITRSVKRGVLLEIRLETDKDIIYFLNTPKGRAAIEAIRKGQWRPAGDDDILDIELDQQPNIYRLYEDNIGPLTPMIADALKEAEDSYPNHWIEDAIRIAVEQNKRSWRYVSAILERWRREGRDVRKEKQEHRGDSEEDYRRYVEGELSDFIEH